MPLSRPLSRSMANKLFWTKGGKLTPFSHSARLTAGGESAQLLFIETFGESVSIISTTLVGRVRFVVGLIVAGVSFADTFDSGPEIARPIAVRSERASSGASDHTVGQV